MAKGSVHRPPIEAEPRVRRGYFECRYGQLHVHNAIPPGGGFEEGTALLCLHRSPFSGSMFRPLLLVMGRDRSVYAPDLPGFGESDPAPTRPSIADYAVALGDFLDTMRFRQIDVLGVQVGALVAAELAIPRPQQVRRLVMLSVPLFTDAEREAYRRAPLPPAPSEDGTHLLTEWRRALESRGARVPLDIAARNFAEKLRNGPHGAWAMSAAAQYPASERLGLVSQSILVLRARDEMPESLARLKELCPRARSVDIAAATHELFDSAADLLAQPLREFLRSSS